MITAEDARRAREDAALDLLDHWFENPGAYGYDCFADPSTSSGRLELADHQIDVICRIRDGHDVTWRAGHGVGKTTTLAILVFYFLLFKPRSKVPTTAPTWHQVKNVLWAEIAKWHDRYRFKSSFKLDRTRLSHIRRPAEWFSIGIASNRATNIEGFHASNLLFLADEAKGIQDQIFDAIDGACSEGGQRIYVSTPGSRFGKFYQSHHGAISRLYSVVHTNGEHAPRVSKKWIDLKRAEWGQESAIYIAKVRGEFPQEGDDVMYPLDWLDAAEEAFVDVDDDGNPLVGHGSHFAIGCDVARFGFNKTVAIGGSIRRFDRLKTWERKPTTETTSTLLGMWREMETDGQTPSLLAVDDSGLGGGVTDQARQAGKVVEAVLFGGSPTERETFANKKAEMANALRKALDENRQARAAGKPGTLALVPNERMKGQLAALRRRYGGKGVLSIVDPDDPSVPASELAPGMKVSPDHAHAAILAYYGATSAVSTGVGYVVHQDQTAVEQRRRRLSSYVLGRGPGR